MNVATISYARNHLSELLRRARQGESVTILDRKRPVATLGPAGQAGGDEAWMQELVRKGVIQPASAKLDARAFLRMPRAAIKGGRSLVEHLMDDREDRL